MIDSIPDAHLRIPNRYDFFYKNGVPKWRGTGYYYTRFRPGIGVSGPPCLTTLVYSSSISSTSSSEKLSCGNVDGLDVPGPSHDGVAIYGSETELCQRLGTNRKDQARCENGSVGKSNGSTGGPKEGKCDLDWVA